MVVGLSPSGWTATGPNSYTYKGPAGAAITRAIFKPNLITFKGGKASWGYTLDEPSQGLAPRMVAALLELVARIRAQGVSVLLVEQNVRRALGLADRGYVLESGRTVLGGSGAELVEHPKVRRAYLGL